MATNPIYRLHVFESDGFTTIMDKDMRWTVRPTEDVRSKFDSEAGPHFLFNAAELIDLLTEAYNYGASDARREVSERLGLQ